MKLQLTIVDVLAQEVGQDKQTKPVVYFKEDKRGLILNKTGFSILAKAHGNNLSESWIGATLELYKDPTVQMSGKVVGGIRFRVVRKAGA